MHEPVMCVWGIPVYPDSRLPEGVVVITSDTTPATVNMTAAEEADILERLSTAEISVAPTGEILGSHELREILARLSPANRVIARQIAIKRAWEVLSSQMKRRVR